MLSEWVKSERERRGWSQIDLAERASLTSSYISRVEAGKRTKPSADVLSRLASAFGMTVDDLLRASNNASRDVSPVSEGEHSTDSISEELLSMWPDLTIQDRTAIIEHAKALWERRLRNRRRKTITSEPQDPA